MLPTDVRELLARRAEAEGQHQFIGENVISKQIRQVIECQFFLTDVVELLLNDYNFCLEIRVQSLHNFRSTCKTI